MNRDQPTPSEFGVTRQLQIDVVCVRFEKQLRTGRHPRIETILNDYQEPLRSLLLRHLLQLEFEYRGGQGEQIEIQDFLDRFPHDQSLIHNVHDEQSRRLRADETELREDTPSANAQADSGIAQSDSSLHGRFLPGTKLADRYRIVSLLGKGGMGEVYRADDLRLGQTVALKFLPRILAREPQRLERFQSEVRLTRQISHPNVCRVYDMDEVDGHPFLSMEFIDGEDLRILLRRIGRLPKDKGIQIAQQLCAGLAAAHDKGVLHRDLKPANIMIDGRGQVRITDFGLAKLTADEQPGEIAGTPAYMAPEQLRHGQTSIQSDLYSLGLIFYELFTGEAVNKAGSIPELLKQQEDSAPSQPTSLVDDMDPVVERVIQRCLAKDPNERPKSAHAVANAMPGADPLAAALAAGETPSPEMVAAAGEKQAMRLWVAATCVIATFVALVLVMLLSDHSTMIGRVGLPLPPGALVVAAKTIITDLGYDESPRDHAYGFTNDVEYIEFVEENDKLPARWDDLAESWPAAIYFWYRQSPRHLVPNLRHPYSGTIEPSRVSQLNPSPLMGGNISLRLDTDGKMIQFIGVPSRLDPPETDSEGGESAVPPTADWTVLFEKAGLNVEDFTTTPSSWVPPVESTQRAAWKPREPSDIERIEAAAYAGRPIFFQVIGAWHRHPQAEPFFEFGGPSPGSFPVAAVVTAILFVIYAYVVPRNLILGRGDRRGAFRLATYIFIVQMLVWLLEASHVLNEKSELKLWNEGLAFALLWVFNGWLMYLTIEPYVRRLWPQMLITWTRLLSGGFRDTLIGRDLLLGAACGAAMSVLHHVVVVTSTIAATPIWDFWIPESLVEGRYWLGTFLINQNYAINGGFFMAVCLLLLRVILRKQWLFFTVVVVLTTLPVILLLFDESPASIEKGLERLAISITIAMAVFLMLRFGVLATMVMYFVAMTLTFPITSDVSSWYFVTGLVALASVMAIAIYGFFNAVGRQPVSRMP